MILPVGDAPNPPRFVAWVNWALLLANVLIYLSLTLPLSMQPPDPSDPVLQEYLAWLRTRLPDGVPFAALAGQVTAWDLVVWEHGYQPAAPEVADLFASMFMHGGFAHLAGNMLFLWIYGDNVEHRIGRLTYLAVYLATGVAATLTFSAFAHSMTPLVGASGAISGVLGLYFHLFPHNRVKLLVVLLPFWVNIWLVPSRVVIGIFVLLDNLLPLLVGAQTGVAYGAHLGGFVAGWGLALLGEHLEWGARPEERVRGPAVGGAATELREAVATRDREWALRVLPGVEEHDLVRLDAPTVAQAGEWLAQSGRPVWAAQVLRKRLAAGASPPEQARLHLALGRAWLSQGQPTVAVQHWLVGLRREPDPETERQLREALRQAGVGWA